MNKKRWTVGRLLSYALALLGFAGCNNNEEEPALYGTPTMDFQVLGTVTDEAGKPLEGIQVIVSPTNSTWFKPDVTSTNKNGQFTSSKLEAISSQEVTVSIKDIDGEANGGEFKEQELTLKEFEEKQTKEKEGWYSGEFEYSKNIKLKKADK